MPEDGLKEFAVTYERVITIEKDLIIEARDAEDAIMKGLMEGDTETAEGLYEGEAWKNFTSDEEYVTHVEEVE